MAINYTTKFQKALDQRYAMKSLSESFFGGKFDFIGAKTAKVYNLTSQALADYTRTGANRYGVPAELQDTTQELTITRDRSFSITVDKGNYIQQNMVKTAANVIKIQNDERYVPETDLYKFTVLSAGATASAQVATAAITKDNAYEKFLDGMAVLDNAQVSRTGRIAIVSPAFYKFIKLDSSFTKASDIAMKALINGQVGEIDGTKIVLGYSAILPANTAFIITHPTGNVCPKQLDEVKVHQDPPGVSGIQVEARWIYDAFVLENKQNGVYWHKIA
jgi:hypothetical protein